MVKKKSYKRAGWKIPILPVIGLLSTQFTTLGNSTINANGPLGGFIINKNPTYLLRDELMQFTGFDSYNNSWTIPMGSAVMVITLIAEKIMNKLTRGMFKGLPIRW